MKPEEVKQHYTGNQEEIKERLEEFEDLRDATDYRKFLELVFVILTSQTEAEKAWKAAESLDERNLILEGDREQIARILEANEVQYERNKADYIVKNREKLSQPTLSNPTNELKLGEKIDENNHQRSREWLAENIDGIKWKGASHFLRNIGYGNGFAIISGHIVTQMHDLGVIKSAERPGNQDEYVDLEQKLKDFSNQVDIDIKALDLVLWSMKTGKVFK